MGNVEIFKKMNLLLTKFNLFFINLYLASALVAAIIPHQGRITVDNLPFDGVGKFKFALVDQEGKVRWNHENGEGVPQSSVSLHVNQGFYNCKLGDISIPGMEPLADDLFSYDDPLSLRIWFSDGSSNIEQLGPDQPLLVAPYATATPWTKTDEIASLLSKELDEQAADKDTSSLSLIERIVSLGSNTLVDEDFNGSISLSMLNDDVHRRIDSLEGNDTNLRSDLSSLESVLDNHINSPTEREVLSQSLQDELNGFASTNQNLDEKISQSDAKISLLEEEQKIHSTKIQNLDGNTTKIIQDLIETNQELSEYKASSIKRSQLEFSLQLELDNISTLNQEQETKLILLDNNITNLSNKEIAREIELNGFEEDLTDIIAKHEEQSVQIVDMVRDLALHNTKDGIQDAYINEINEGIEMLKDADEFTDSKIAGLNEDITNIMVTNTIQEANLTSNQANISTLSADLTNLDGNFSAFQSLVEKYLKPEIEQEPTVGGNSTPSDFTAGETILIEIEASGKFLNYQWFRRPKNNINGAIEYGDPITLPNSNSREYPINSANASEHEGLYHVEVSNEFGDVNSSEIKINIL